MRRPNHALPFAALVTASFFALAGAASAQTIALDVTGPQANPGKQQRCNIVAQRAGFAINPSAPLRVTLTLLPGFNRLQITSARRGEVLNQNRPGWGMEQLCQDAIQQASNALAHDHDGPAYAAPPPQAYQQPAYQQPYQAPPPGSAQMIAFDVTGSQANSGKQVKCLRLAQQRGFVVNPSAPVRVMLILQPGMNRLQITSARRGEVLNQARPPWGMDQLCLDALTTVTQVLAQEGEAPVGSPPPQGAYGSPQQRRPQRPQGLALGPIPPAPELAPNVKAIADGAVAAWQAAQFEAALHAFREAGRISNDPQFLFDQAVCEQHLGRYAEALTHTQQFIDRAPQSAYRPYAEQLFGELQASNGMD